MNIPTHIPDISPGVGLAADRKSSFKLCRTSTQVCEQARDSSLLLLFLMFTYLLLLLATRGQVDAQTNEQSWQETRVPETGERSCFFLTHGDPCGRDDSLLQIPEDGKGKTPFNLPAVKVPADEMPGGSGLQVRATLSQEVFL